MKIRLLIAHAGLAIGFAVSSFAQQKDSAADPELTQKIRAISEGFIQAVTSNNPAAIAALFTEDGVFVTDTGPLFGRQAIEKRYADIFQQWHVNSHTTKFDPGRPHLVGTEGNAVWETGEWGETLQGKSGDPVQIKGYWSALDRREGEDWKIWMLTINMAPAPAPTTTPSNP